jgi:hypothetical protein
MVNFLSVLSLLFSLQAFAVSVPSGLPAISMGHQSTTTTQMQPLVIADGSNSLGWFTVISYGEGTNGNVSPFIKNGVKYQVTAGKTAKCYGISGQTSAANSSFQLMYADATFAHDATTGSLTNPVYESNVAGQYVHTFYSLVPAYFGVSFDVPAEKFFGRQGTSLSGTHLTVTCREI